MVRSILWLGPSRVFNSLSCLHWASSNLFFFLIIPTLALFSIQESLLQYAVIPCVHLCVAPVLGKTVFSVSSSLFQIQEELIFSIYSPFYIYSNGIVTFKCLTHRTRIHPKYSFFNGRRYFFSSTFNSLAKQVTKCWVHEILIYHLVCKEQFF